MSTAKGPVLFDLDDDAPAPTPAEAPPVPDLLEPAPQGQAMTTVAALAARPVSRLARWFWSLLLMLITTVASVAAWNFVTDLVSQNLYLGYAVAGLFGLFLLVVLLILIKELSAFARLGRIDDPAALEKSLANADIDLSDEGIRFELSDQNTNQSSRGDQDAAPKKQTQPWMLDADTSAAVEHAVAQQSRWSRSRINVVA